MAVDFAAYKTLVLEGAAAKYKIVPEPGIVPHFVSSYLLLLADEKTC